MRSRLVQTRKNHNKTQEEVANFLGVTARHYRQLESGASYGSVRIWEQLSQRFNVSINALLSQNADIKQPDYSNSDTDGIEEAKELELAVKDFDPDVGAILNKAKKGRLDEPGKKEIALRLWRALGKVLGGAA
jgi:transcriptional regulator with XRE-family HTH domain